MLRIAPTTLDSRCTLTVEDYHKKETTILPAFCWNMISYPSLLIALFAFRSWHVVYGAINYSSRDLLLHEGGRNAWKF
jgi:hypothetical protein